MLKNKTSEFSLAFFRNNIKAGPPYQYPIAGLFLK